MLGEDAILQLLTALVNEDQLERWQAGLPEEKKKAAERKKAQEGIRRSEEKTRRQTGKTPEETEKMHDPTASAIGFTILEGAISGAVSGAINRGRLGRWWWRKQPATARPRRNDGIGQQVQRRGVPVTVRGGIMNPSRRLLTIVLAGLAANLVVAVAAQAQPGVDAAGPYSRLHDLPANERRPGQDHQY